MRRPLLILLLIVLIGGGLVAGAYFVSLRLSTKHFALEGDDLAWLAREFELTEAEQERVRTLHEGYLPHCRKMCERIALKQGELREAVAGATNVTEELREKLAEVGALRAQCQAHMLQHFFQVSRAMPTEQGRRYLAEMRRLTLGHHEQIERAMSNGPRHGHR